MVCMDIARSQRGYAETFYQVHKYDNLSRGFAVFLHQQPLFLYYQTSGNRPFTAAVERSQVRSVEHIGATDRKYASVASGRSC